MSSALTTSAMTRYDPWPDLPYARFAPTAHLLHMASQMLGKLKLATPYEPQWANVPLWVTSSGLSTGPIPVGAGTVTAGLDLVEHRFRVATTWGCRAGFALGAGSVRDLFDDVRGALHATGAGDLSINPVPQEVDDPVPFDLDGTVIDYDPDLANAWWRILVSTSRVLRAYRARFWGVTPPPGLMWGTFDLRDARYHGPRLPVGPRDSGYIRRNAMNRACVEAGFWHGSAQHPAPIFYSFAHPLPAGNQPTKIEIGGWSTELDEYVLEYDLVRTGADPADTLLRFLTAAYRAGAARCGWPENLVGTGQPDPARRPEQHASREGDDSAGER